MRLLPFKQSAECSLGIELEYQIINPKTYAHISRASDLIDNIQQYPLHEKIKPEITQSMIEINSSIHTSINRMAKELIDLKLLLANVGNTLGVSFCGGGTHPFQRWVTEKIFPTKRFKTLSAKYRYLSKRSTVFAMHVHVGCGNCEDALYLTHAFARFIPQIIAISASSPFYQGIDTSYASSRVNTFNCFPLSGVIPFVTNWDEFSEYYYLMQTVNIIHSMKDFYWDIRPKPEFGTVEIRICDTPLTVSKAVIIAAYIQSLACYLLRERPVNISRDLYYLYNYNRFEASRYGYDGKFVNASTKESCNLHQDILATIDTIRPYADNLGNSNYLTILLDDVTHKRNDANYLRTYHKKNNSFLKVASELCNQWVSEL